MRRIKALLVQIREDRKPIAAWVQGHTHLASDISVAEFIRRGTHALRDQIVERLDQAPFVTKDASSKLLSQAGGELERFLEMYTAVNLFRTQIIDAMHQDKDPWEWDTRNSDLRAANKTSLVATSLMHSLAMLHAEKGREQLALPAGTVIGKHATQGEDNVDSTEPQSLARSVEPDSPHIPTDTLFQTLVRAFPHSRESILQWRRESIGFLPVGGKIHVLHAIDENTFAMFRLLFEWRNTPFRLIHANESLLLPATPSAGELKIIIASLVSAGVIRKNYPELQIGLPERIRDARHVAVLGSSILLATEQGIEYDQNAFSTTHDSETGAHIMAYDAGGRNVRLPYVTQDVGRTDMLGRVSLNDIDLYQLLGTVLIHRQSNGLFDAEADEYLETYEAILRKHGISHILDESWIMQDGFRPRNTDSARSHYQTVKTCTDAYFACAEQHRRTGQEAGIVFDVRAALDALRQRVRVKQEMLLDHNGLCNTRKEAGWVTARDLVLKL